jgi:hypothetical protein
VQHRLMSTVNTIKIANGNCGWGQLHIGRQGMQMKQLHITNRLSQ